MSEPATPDVEHAFDADKHIELARAIEKLSPEEAAYFLWKLEISIKKRKVQLVGYLVAMLIWLIGMVVALVIFGMTAGFVGWVFLAPFAAVGVILLAFGKWANKIGSTKPPETITVEMPESR